MVSLYIKIVKSIHALSSDILERMRSHKNPIVYVTRDIERALGHSPMGETFGMEPNDNYFIITNKTPQAETLQIKYPNSISLVQSAECRVHNTTLLDTFELLSSPETQEIISKHKASIMVFQNNSRIERLCKEKNWKLLNPSAKLSKKIEEKISQIEWLGELSSFLPPHQISTLTALNSKLLALPFVLQFNHAHTGEGTYIIENDKKLSILKSQFPERDCRITDFIDGPVFTANVVVGDEILVGNISYQITGLSPFTDTPFATIGNDWALPYRILKKEEGKEIEKMADALGGRLQRDGWKGLFGIDIIQDSKTRKIYLLEINARQPASTTFESQLQKKSGSDLTIFEAHILALQAQSLKNKKLQKIKSGAQIVLRNTNHPNYSSILQNTRITDVIKKLESKDFKVMKYENTEHNKELLRIQTAGSFMKSHNTLSTEGALVQAIIWP